MPNLFYTLPFAGGSSCGATHQVKRAGPVFRWLGTTFQPSDSRVIRVLQGHLDGLHGHSRFLSVADCRYAWMKQLPLLLVSLGSYLVLKALQWKGVAAVWAVSDWCYDLLALPAILSASCLVLRLLYKLPQLVLPLGAVWATAAAVALAFEVILPASSTAYTADGWDVLMCGLGALLYVLLRAKPALPTA